MRETKFRAWDRKDKKIRKVDTINWFDEYCYLDESLGGSIFYRRLEDIDLVQYTGLKDKNGKEVYEGDIFKDCIEGAINIVEYDESSASYFSKFLYSERDRRDIINEIEIIGNVYENPEILTK